MKLNKICIAVTLALPIASGYANESKGSSSEPRACNVVKKNGVWVDESFKPHRWAGKMTYKSLDKNVVDVDAEKGVLTPHATGIGKTAIIEATQAGTFKATSDTQRCTVKVMGVNALTWISDQSATFNPDQPFMITKAMKGSSDDNRQIVYRSSNPKVATISPDGTTITMKLFNEEDVQKVNGKNQVTFTATQDADDRYEKTVKSFNLIITPAKGTISQVDGTGLLSLK